MSQAGYNMEALEGCRSTLEGKAGPVGAIGDGFENNHVDSAIFGKLGAAGDVASAIGDVDSAAKREFDAAEQRLRSASSALDAVRTSVEETDQANADAMRG